MLIIRISSSKFKSILCLTLNSCLFFRPSNDLNMTDEVNPAPEGVESGSFEDPLTDPLAIDDDVDGEIVEIPLETENVFIENVIFVDIEKLKHKVKDDEQSKSDDNLKESKSSLDSDINGNNHHSLKVQKEIADKVEQKQIKNKNLSKDVAQVLETKSEKECEASSNLYDLNKSADSSFAISVISSEPETEEATDTSILLEEIRSDGSDSGLGSDSLRSISAIEKNLANLTPSKSSLKRRSADSLHEDQAKKVKRSINFGDITVFYFPRCQGFGCVPTQGGSTLGMTAKHAYKKQFTLAEHAVEQRRLYRLKMAGNELNSSSSSSDDSKSDEEISENSLSEGDSEAYGFLQPVTARQRRALLKAAGVRKIDTAEKDECRQLRTSREVCGCTCRGYCDPDTCECSLAGIKCQVDRLKPHEFPCGCTRDGCANVNGRIEFNPARVKTHFIHTIMRLELEKRQEMSENSTNTTVIQNPSKWWSQMRQQTSQASTSCTYVNYSYNTPLFPSKIPPITTMASPTVMGQESLDLHYAYRDDYIANSSSINTENGNSFINTSGSDYFSAYNYNNHYQNGYQTMHHQQASQLSYQHQLQPSNFNGSDCQYSNYSSTNGSNRYHPRMDLGVEMNGFTYHNGAQPRINYQPPTSTSSQGGQEELENFCTIPPSNSLSSTILENPATAQIQNDSSEILSEIIKKSIVETVTA